ncbi:hypothetical protein PAEPH01_2795, partial [Pancytospora epiphaga]
MNSNKTNLPQFIEKLYSILNDSQYASCIGWGLSDDSFVIINPSEFSTNVLAKHFKHRNLSSFVRQLNKYDFHKVKSNEKSKMKWGNSVWEFEHMNFRKNRPDLLPLISRKLSPPEKNSGKEKMSDFENVRDYNSMLNGYLVNTMSNISRYFELISEDLSLVKKFILNRNTESNQNEMKVLIAEDNPSCAAYAASIFKRNNYLPVSAESVNEIKFLLENKRFNMFLLSGCIPDVLDIIRVIRNHNSTTPLVLTA